MAMATPPTRGTGWTWTLRSPGRSTTLKERDMSRMIGVRIKAMKKAFPAIHSSSPIAICPVPGGFRRSTPMIAIGSQLGAIQRMLDQNGTDSSVPLVQLTQVQHEFRLDLEGGAEGEILALKVDFQNAAFPAEMQRFSKLSVRQQAQPDYRLRAADGGSPGGGVGGSGRSQALAAVPPRVGHARIITYLVQFCALPRPRRSRRGAAPRRRRSGPGRVPGPPDRASGLRPRRTWRPGPQPPAWAGGAQALRTVRPGGRCCTPRPATPE